MPEISAVEAAGLAVALVCLGFVAGIWLTLEIVAAHQPMLGAAWLAGAVDEATTVGRAASAGGVVCAVIAVYQQRRGDSSE